MIRQNSTLCTLGPWLMEKMCSFEGSEFPCQHAFAHGLTSYNIVILLQWPLDTLLFTHTASNLKMML